MPPQAEQVKVFKHVAVQVVDVDNGNSQPQRQALGEACSYQQRAHKPRTTREGDCRELLLGYAGTLYSLVDDRHHILLMRTRCQLRNDATISLVDFL